MKNSFQFRSLLFVCVLATGLMVSCKNKEATVDETTTETTTEMDTTAMPVTPEETTMPADTTTTGEPTGATPAK